MHLNDYPWPNVPVPPGYLPMPYVNLGHEQAPWSTIDLSGEEMLTEGFYWFRWLVPNAVEGKPGIWTKWEVVYLYGQAPFMRLERRYGDGDYFKDRGIVPPDYTYELVKIEQPGEGSK